MKMKNIYFTILILILFYSVQYAQGYGYLYFDEYNAAVYSTTDGNHDNIVYWSNNIKQSGLTVQEFDTENIDYPSELFFYKNEIKQQADNCISQWNSGGCLSLSKSETFPACPMRFVDDYFIFPDDDHKGFTAFAVTTVDQWYPPQYQFVQFSSGSYSQYAQTGIILNGNAFRNFEWSTTLEQPTNPQYITPFKPILLHEMGHLVGLGHRDNLIPPVVMNKMTNINNYVFNLTDEDKDQRSAVCDYNGTPTGIEDYIWLYDDEPNYPYNVNTPYVGRVHQSFQDVYPYGDYIVAWDNWKVKASYGCGKVLVYESNDYSSYINIPTLPNGYLWNRDANGNVLATLSTGGTDNDNYHHTATIPIKIGNVPNSFVTSGTLTADTTYWCGDITVTGTITVPSGKVLKVSPTSVMRFPNNTSLIVYGKLEADGCTFTSQSGSTYNSWGSIELNGAGASGSYIRHATIQYGNEVREINIQNFEISNCSFINNYISIYSSGSTGSIFYNNLTSNSIGHSIDIEGSSTVSCYGNTISKTSPNQTRGVGILIGGGCIGVVYENDISFCDWGIGGIWSAMAIASDYSSFYNGNNHITNCNVGINIYRNSIGQFGYQGSYIDNSHNSIHDNTKNAIVGTSYPTYPSNLYAMYNWWGAFPPDPNKFSQGSGSHLYTDNPLQDDPFGSLQKAVTNDNGAITSNSIEEPVTITQNDPNSIFSGFILLNKKDYKAAKSFFISYLSKHPDDQSAYIALYNCYTNDDGDDLINYFNSLPKEASKDHKLLLSYLYLKQGNIQMAKKVNEEVISENPNTVLAAKANVNNLFIALYNDNNIEKATSLFNNVSKNTESLLPSELADIDYEIETYVSIHSNQLPGSNTFNKSANINKVETPKEYSLLGNYPNPFNPTTTISYNLPRMSDVELKIYDILGNEVKSFFISSQYAGTQNIVWNGTNNYNEQVSSGIYIYRFRAVSREGKYEVFEKSAKLIMLK